MVDSGGGGGVVVVVVMVKTCFGYWSLGVIWELGVGGWGLSCPDGRTARGDGQRSTSDK